MTTQTIKPELAYLQALDQLAAVSCTDASGRIVHVNAAFERLTGYTAQELLGKPHSLLKSGHHDAAFYQSMWETLRSGKTWKGKICNRRKTGELYWSDLSIVPIPAQGDLPATYLSVRNEIAVELHDDQIQMSKRLSADAILEHAPLILLGVDQTGKLLWNNDFLSRATGWPLDQVERALSSGIIFSSPDDEALFQQLWTAEQEVWVPIPIKTHSGTVLYGAWQSIRNLDGTYLIVGVDQTREVEQAKTIADQQIQLVSAAKLSTLGELAAGIAHEINNPVAIIHGKAGNIIRTLSGPTPQIDKAATLSHDIIRSAERIVKIVKGLRVLARSSQDEVPMPESLKSLVSEAVDLCHEKTRSQGIELKLPEIPESAMVQVAGVQFGQVIVNLINNACDAIKDRPGDLWVRLEYQDLQDKISLSVVDCGEGIPEAIRVKMMTPFFTTKPKGQGTGLGLTISIKIIESFGGRLYIDDKCPNTRFVIEMPKASATKSSQRSAA